MLIAEIIVYGAIFYAAAGVVLGVWFAAAGAGRLDPAARGAGAGFRVVVFVGAAALWIVLLPRVLKTAEAEES